MKQSTRMTAKIPRHIGIHNCEAVYEEEGKDCEQEARYKKEKLRRHWQHRGPEELHMKCYT